MTVCFAYRPTISSHLHEHSFCGAPPPSFYSAALGLKVRICRPSLHLRRASPPSPLAAASFEAMADSGLVECFSSGCRPIFPEPEDSHNPGMTPLLADTQARRDVLRSNGVWADLDMAECYYESALQLEPDNALLLVEYALFVWTVVADSKRAHSLFLRALDVAPCDPTILGSYASFLWQTETA